MKKIKIIMLALLFSIILATGCTQQNEEPATPITPPAESTIQVDVPTPNETIKSPLIISGTARGSWYFEAIFSVSLVDNGGNKIASTSLRALTDWMSEDFVPFTGKLEFSAETTGSGKLIFENANPSGMPEKSVKYEVPVSW